MSQISRRGFLKGVAASAIGVGVMGASALAEDKKDIQWDAEYDVVVLGYGGAGANAAVAASEAGAKVLLTDKAPAGLEGGNTQASGQFVMSTDDPEQLYIYLTTLMGKFDNWDDEAVRAYCEGCAENYAWMVGPMGGDPDIICPTYPTVEKAADETTTNGWFETENPYGIGRKGYVYRWQEFPEYESGKHCWCLTASGGRFDRSYYNLCQAAVEAHDIEVWASAPGKKLLTDDTGAVIGCIIEKDGKDLKVKANGGVILATGGFEHNQEMIASYLQQPYVHQRGGLYNDGDGIKMAMGVGADLWHMSNSAGFSWTYQNPKLSTVGLMGPNAKMGVIVGLGGTRFMNEAAQNRHGRIDIGGRWISTPMPLPSYVVHDQAQLNEGKKFMSTFSDGYAEEIAAGEVLVGNTLEELAEAIRQSNGGEDAPDFSTEKFVATIAAYNKRFDAGEDADYGRPFSTMVPVKDGPFYALKIGPTYFNTMGGPRRNAKAQVINVDGYPIEGLFSAGELGSIFCDMYNGSGNLGETMVFGRIAGFNAAARAKGEFVTTTEPAHIWQGESNEIKQVEMVTGTYKDGVYEGVGTGFNGTIAVSVTVEGGKIAKVEVLKQAETANIGGVALPEYCDAVVAAQSLEIDAVASASNTLKGFKEAVNDALSKAL